MVILTNKGASASSSSTHRWDYEVFLNFRGEDFYNNFTGHLYKALSDQGFKIFIDDSIQKGEEISMEFVKAIESSMILIVIFSKNFASSTWGLNKLAKIFECRRSNGQLVFPIFYKVSPSEIRKQDKEFGIALAGHEEKFKDDINKVQRWRTISTKAANLSGFHYNDNCTEFEFIQRVKKEISSTISNHVPLFVAKCPVGIDIRAEAIELLLDMESNDVCMVGICGFRGIGKTTILKAVYNRIAHHFEGSCFLENVREMSKINGGIIQLQAKLLSKILRDRDLEVHNVFEGINLIKKRLRSKKVLLVLDGVEDLKEVENLLGGCDWFASGSRVIITTRHKHVLTTLGRDSLIYEVAKLSQREALELFNQHTFRTSKYGEDYSKLAKQITSLPIGLPLALKTIGSHLRGKNIHEWKIALEKYKDIQELKMSNTKLENVFNQGLQNENLKIIDLSWCKSLTKVPDLCSPNLEELKHVFCENLIEVHESIGFLEKLKVWNLHGCSQLQILPSTLMLKSLRYFDLEGCLRLEKFPDIHPEMNCLKKLYLFSSGIRELPSSLLYLTGLDTLRLASCNKLTDFLIRANKSQMQEEVDIPFANLISVCNSLNNFWGPIGFLSLTELNLNGCVGIKPELDSWMQLDYFLVLTVLHLASTGIVTIPESISRFTRLKYLYIRDCIKLQEIPRLPQSIRTVNAQNCYRLDPQSSSRLWNQFGEIIGILPNTVTQAARSSKSKIYHFLILPTIEIPKWFKFNHHQSVGNSVSFLVGPKFSNLVVCIAFPSKDVNTNMGYFWSVKISINGCKQQNICQWYDNYQSKNTEKKYDNYDHVWLIYGEVNITNPSEENRIEVEVIGEGMNISLNRMRIYVECICCPQKPNISPASSLDQWAFNNGEEDSGRVRIRRRLQ